MRRATVSACVALLLVPPGGCGPSDVATEPDAAAILRRVGFPLPAGAVIEQATMQRGLDDNARIVAVLPDATWQRIAKRLHAIDPAAPPFAADANALLGPDGADWAPSRTAGLRTSQYRWRDGTEALNLGVAPAGAGRVRILLFWHEL